MLPLTRHLLRKTIENSSAGLNGRFPTSPAPRAVILGLLIEMLRRLTCAYASAAKNSPLQPKFTAASKGSYQGD